MAGKAVILRASAYLNPRSNGQCHFPIVWPFCTANNDLFGLEF